MEPGSDHANARAGHNQLRRAGPDKKTPQHQEGNKNVRIKKNNYALKIFYDRNI